MRAPRRCLTSPLVILALVVVLASCSSGSDGSEDGLPTTAAATAPAGDLEVAIVADSEIPPGVEALVDAVPGIDVVSSELHDGFKMAQLDPFVADALAGHPDVLVYSGSTNDLESGPQALLSGLEERLSTYVADTCVVMAVPVFRYQQGTAEEVEQRTAGTRVLEEAAARTGAHVASYLDVAIAMGEDFFAEGELGDLHPSPAAHGSLAASIVAQIKACRAS